METENEHFSNQVKDARQVFMGFPSEKLSQPHVVSVGFEKCMPDFKIERESYPQIGKSNPNNQFTTIEFIIAGTGELKFSDSSFQLSAGSFFSYKIATYHRITSSSDDPMVKYFIVLAHSPTFKIYTLTENKTNFNRISQHVEIIELFELILGNANSGTKNGILICNLLAHSLVLKISELTHSLEEKQARSWDTYNRILLYLRKNYFRIKTIEELASEVNVDPAYLSRVFRRFHNETPYRFLIRLKMGHAASLLLSSRRLVKDIAFELGFENPFHFSRTFKSVYGVSPENFI